MVFLRPVFHFGFFPLSAIPLFISPNIFSVIFPTFYPSFPFSLFHSSASFFPLLSFLLSFFLFSPFRVPFRCLPLSILRSTHPFVPPLSPLFILFILPRSEDQSGLISLRLLRRQREARRGLRGRGVTQPDRSGRGRSVSGGRDQVTIWKEAFEALRSAVLALGSGV